MSTLYEAVKRQHTMARIQRNASTSQLLGLVLSESDRFQKQDDGTMTKIISDMVKNAVATADQLPVGDIRHEKAINEAQILRQFLPELMTGEELRANVEALAKTFQFASMKDFGKVKAMLQEAAVEQNKRVDFGEASRYFKAFIA
ncbi:tRNA amidotransferase [Vibrio phage EniLVp02]